MSHYIHLKIEHMNIIKILVLLTSAFRIFFENTKKKKKIIKKSKYLNFWCIDYINFKKTYYLKFLKNISKTPVNISLKTLVA